MKAIDYIDKIPWSERFKAYVLFNRNGCTYIAPVEDDFVIETKADKLMDCQCAMINGATHLLINEEGFYYCVDTWDGLQAVPNFYPGLGHTKEKENLEQKYIEHYIWE